MHNEQFRKNLDYLMHEHGITNYRLAKTMGVHATTIANWLNGVSMPNIGKQEYIADIFKISRDQLLGDELPPIVKEKPQPIKFDISKILIQDDDLFLDMDEIQNTAEGHKRFLREMAKVVENINSDGCEKIRRYAEDIAEIEKYRINKTAGLSIEANDDKE